MKRTLSSWWRLRKFALSLLLFLNHFIYHLKKQSCDLGATLIAVLWTHCEPHPPSSSDLGWATFCSLTSSPEKSRTPTCMTRTPSRSTTRATPSTNGGERRARRSWRRRKPRGEVVRSKVRTRHLTQRPVVQNSACPPFHHFKTRFKWSPGSNIWFEDQSVRSLWCVRKRPLCLKHLQQDCDPFVLEIRWFTVQPHLWRLANFSLPFLILSFV